MLSSLVRPSSDGVSLALQEEGTSAGLDGEPGMTRAARSAEEAEQASRLAEELAPVTYNYSFFHFVFALASMYLAMLMTGKLLVFNGPRLPF
jgi:hypothetical protein